jgi:hypothetical protein
MTAQAMERLILNGREVSIATEPLASYLSKLKEKPPLVSPTTACWRGYYGTWEIKDNKLYLIKFEGYTLNHPDETELRKVGIHYIFPTQTRVFAKWYSGEIRIPEGNIIKYVHFGYESIFESDLLLEFKKGFLIGQRTVENILKPD